MLRDQDSKQDHHKIYPYRGDELCKRDHSNQQPSPTVRAGGQRQPYMCSKRRSCQVKLCARRHEVERE